MDKIIKIKCVTCASPVLLNQSDEGTCFYTPLYREDDVRELLDVCNRLRFHFYPGHKNGDAFEAALSKFKHIDNETPPEVNR